jgi:hypothetical protein
MARSVGATSCAYACMHVCVSLSVCNPKRAHTAMEATPALSAGELAKHEESMAQLLEYYRLRVDTFEQEREEYSQLIADLSVRPLVLVSPP